MMNQTKAVAAETQKKREAQSQSAREPSQAGERMGGHSVMAQAAYQRMRVNPVLFRPADAIALQRTVGNRQVQRMLARRTTSANGEQQNALTEENPGIKVQTKLTVGAPNDIYEQEANQVMTRVAPATAQPGEREIESEEQAVDIQAKLVATSFTPRLQLEIMPEEEEKSLQTKPSLQQAKDGGSFETAHKLPGVVQQAKKEQANLIHKKPGKKTSVGKPKPDPEKVRVAKLEHDYETAVNAGNWKKAALLLNGFNDEDILSRIKKLKKGKLSGMYQGALKSMPGWSGRVTKPIEQLEPEVARVAKLNFDYESAVEKNNWAKAAEFLNGFNDDDIFKKLGKLNTDQRKRLEEEALKTMKGWSDRVTKPIDKINDIAAGLSIKPEWLMAVIGFETGGTYSTSQRNVAGSGAVGLIQFMPSTAKRLGTTTSALAKMTPIQQLDYVKQYFEPYKGKIKTFTDLYMTVLYPVAVGKGENYVLFTKGSKEYEQNAGLDFNHDGKVTAGEAAAGPEKFLPKEK